MNFLLLENHEVCSSKESKSTDLSFQKIEFLSIKYDNKKNIVIEKTWYNAWWWIEKNHSTERWLYEQNSALTC